MVLLSGHVKVDPVLSLIRRESVVELLFMVVCVNKPIEFVDCHRSSYIYAVMTLLL